MSLFDELDSALRGAQRMLNGLGPKPKGDVEGMKDLARALRSEASTIGTESSSVRSINHGVIFDGPGRSGFDGNTSAVISVLNGSASKLEAAATRVSTEATRIEHAQKQWQRDHDHLSQQIANLGSQLRNVFK